MKFNEVLTSPNTVSTLRAVWTNVRLFDEQGDQVREGISASEAFNIARRIEFINNTYEFNIDCKIENDCETNNNKLLKK